MTKSRARATISTSHELQQHRNQTFKDWTCSRHAFTMLLQRPAQETCPFTLSKVDGCEDGTPCWPSCAGSRTTPTCTDSGAVNNGRLGQKSSMVVPQVLACPTPLLAALPAQVRPPSASEPDGGIISYREPHHNLPREPEPQPSGWPSSLFYHRLSLKILLGEGSSSSNFS